MMAWIYLGLAIATEVAGTLELRALAHSGSRVGVLALVTVAYVASFAFMALALKQIGVATVYAIWSGVGTASIAVLGQVLFGEKVSWQAAVGMVLIVSGVVLLAVYGPAETAPLAGHASASPAEGP